MTKPILFLLWGAALASAWWAVGTKVVNNSSHAIIAFPTFMVCLFGSIGTLLFLAIETINNWKD